MQEHGREDHVDRGVCKGQAVAARLSEVDWDTQSLCPGVAIAQAGCGDIQTINLGVGEGLFPGQGVMANGAADVDYRGHWHVRPSQPRKICHRVTDVIQSFTHNAKGENLQTVIVDSPRYQPGFRPLSLVVAGHQVHIHLLCVGR